MHHFRCVQCDLIINTLWKGFCQFGHTGFHSLSYIKGVRARKLINRNTSCRLSLQTRYDIVPLTTQLYMSYIFQAKNPSVLFYTKNDFPEFIRRVQSSFYIQCILESIATRPTKGLSDISCRNFHVLRLNSGINLLGTKITDAHSLRIKPNAHGIVTGPHNIDRTYPRHTSQLVHQIQVCIVSQIKTVINAIARQSKHHHNIR